MITKIKGLLFKNTGTSQTVLKNTFWLSFGQISGRLIRAAVIIYAARMLGVAEYGVFSYVLGLAGFFSVFSDIGVSSILTREAAKRPENRAQIFATTFWIKMALLLGTAAAIMLLRLHFPKSRLRARSFLLWHFSLSSTESGISPSLSFALWKKWK